MFTRRSTSVRSPSLLAPLLLAGAASVAACGGGGGGPSAGATGDAPRITFRAEQDLLPGFSYATGLEPAGAPVEASLSLSASGTASVEAQATPSGSSSAPEITGLPGTGKLALHGGFALAGELKVALDGLPSYDGPIPGLDDVTIAVDGDAAFDPFAMGRAAELHARIPPAKLPPIPLPGGIPGRLVLEVVDGSFLQLDVTGRCAGIDGSEATYVAHVDRSGTLVIKPVVEVDVPVLGTQTYDVPEVTVDLSLGGSDVVMTAKVDAFARAAPAGDTSTIACRAEEGTGGAGGAGAGGGATASSSAGPASSSSTGSASSSSSGSGSGSGSGSSSSSSSGSGGGASTCAVHDGDVSGCDADPQHCAYFLCSSTCWPAGTQLSDGCGHGMECDTAIHLDDVRGDEGADVRVAHGHGTEWFRVWVSEVSNGINDLRTTVTLNEPTDAHYELYVYEGDANQPGCGATPAKGAGDPPAVGTDVPDTALQNQGHFVSIEVRHVSGLPGADWTLTVQGNFLASCQADGACTTSDDCVCPDCRTDAYCSSPASCNHDGICDTYDEGCACDDCAGAPICGAP
ncbi:MAG TPA: hypothetical protein VHB21_22065 [Minicystis sp.]|nr:hypothetical protein [Minicystis sp.]